MREGWEYKKLGEICEIFGRIGFRGYTREDYVNTIEEGAISLSPSNIINNQLDFSNCTYITWDKFNQSPEIKIVEGDVLFVKTASVGKCAYVSVLPHESTINPQFVVFKNISISNRFLFYQLLSSSFQYKVKRITSGTSVPTITQKGLSELKICYPNISEQQRIVSELDLLSSIIEKKKAQLKEYDQLAQSIFYDMFGDPVTNEKGWDKSSLSKMGLLARGVSKHRPRNAPELLGGTMPLIQTGDVSNADFYIRNYTSTYSDLGVSQSKIWKAGTLCITIAATIGKCAILSFDACFPDSVVGFAVNNKLCNNEYVFFIFKCLQSILEENAPSVAQKNINLKVLNELELPLPPLTLQQSFASKIEAIERQKALVQQSITETETLFNSRMDYYFN